MNTFTDPHPLSAGLYAAAQGRPVARLTYRRCGVEFIVESIHSFTQRPRRDVVQALVRSASRRAEAEGRVLVGVRSASLTTQPAMVRLGG